MSSEEFRNELNSGKPLFSIQVDDVLVQEIFQKLSEQIADQRREIDELKKELKARPTVEEFVALSEAVNKIQSEYSASSSSFSKTVDAFYTSLNEKTKGINELVQQKTNEMLFAVNASIRSQMEMIENSPKMTQDALESIHDLKLKYSKALQKIDDLKDSVIQIAAAFDGSPKVEGLDSRNAYSCIKAAAERDRRNLAQMKSEMENFKGEFNTFKETFEVTLPFSKYGYPQWQKGVIYNRSKKPTFPAEPKGTSVYEYINYMGKTFPYIQAVLRELHSYVQQVDATVEQKTDRGEFEVSAAKTQKMVTALVADVEDYRVKRDQFVFHQDFEELAGDVYGIVNGASNAAATNTHCIVCGKRVQRTVGSIAPGTNRALSQQSPLSARGEKTTKTSDVLRYDGLQQEPVLGIRRITTARSGKRLAVPK